MKEQLAQLMEELARRDAGFQTLMFFRNGGVHVVHRWGSRRFGSLAELEQDLEEWRKAREEAK